MRRAVTIITAAVLSTPFPCVSTQGQPPVEQGEWIRVTHDCPKPGAPPDVPWCKIQSGTVDVITADSLVLTLASHGMRLTVPVASVTNIRVQRRLSRGAVVGRGAAIGGGTLGALMMFFGLAATGECKGGWDLSLCGASLDEVLAATALAGGIGAGIGALIGSVVPRGHRWVWIEHDRLRMSFVRTRDGVSLGMSVSF